METHGGQQARTTIRTRHSFFHTQNKNDSEMESCSEETECPKTRITFVDNVRRKHCFQHVPNEIHLLADEFYGLCPSQLLCHTTGNLNLLSVVVRVRGVKRVTRASSGHSMASVCPSEEGRGQSGTETHGDISLVDSLDNFHHKASNSWQGEIPISSYRTEKPRMAVDREDRTPRSLHQGTLHSPTGQNPLAKTSPRKILARDPIPFHTFSQSGNTHNNKKTKHTKSSNTSIKREKGDKRANQSLHDTQGGVNPVKTNHYL